MGWNYPLSAKARRRFVGYLEGAVRESVLTKHLTNIMDSMDDLGGWERPESSLGGRMSRGTKWMVQEGCYCPYSYGGVRVDPVHFPPWMRTLMADVMPLCGYSDPSQWPNSCNLNCYADGTDSIGWH